MSLGQVVKPESYLNCLYTNATYLNDFEKLFDLESMMSQLDNRHVVNMTETRFCNYSALHVEGYHLHSRYRVSRGGYGNTVMETYASYGNTDYGGLDNPDEV